MESNSTGSNLLEYCTAVRRHLHRHPEISFCEEKTAEYIQSELERLGIRGTRVAGTGVYAVLESGRPGPAVAVRADIDALPVQEENDVPYASSVRGVMHACGHDGHAAILLGLASVLQTRTDDIRGKVVLVFQPAEEIPPGGAQAVIDSGILEGVEAVLGLHLTSILPTGTVGVRGGPLMASVDNFMVDIKGRGGHGSMPHLTVDPIVIGCQLVSAWQTIVSRMNDPVEPAVLTVGTFNAGTVSNVIPEKAVLSGTVRTLSGEVRSRIEADFRKVTEDLCRGLGAEVEIAYGRGYPVLVNDEKLTALVGEAAAECLGGRGVIQAGQLMGGEDFAYYGSLCPASYFFLGAGNPGRGFTHPNHSPRFDFDEEAMPLGVRIFTAALERLWAGKN